ncbi:MULTISPECIES: hypothetical protein [Desulfobacula]|uniref:Conserved uncharacterized protein n=2 Tax=Desulfobacula TaxID=28222 RepID=K0NNX2_DESTT|nr:MULTISPECIES: hypothetical protein [Desulfobacula]CCK81788.1 conserved uncharacterized protein [Desulfobacula toluolica Tol2]SDT86101.1 hypothetical protein SAMN04487931_102155 [Desulfobacula phenolica]
MDEAIKLLSISRVLEKMINHTANDIFYTYRDMFLMMENTYIVPAVWGAMENGELDETQKEIHKKIKKLVNDSISALFIKNMTDPQAFAIKYLVNRTMIYTISYMIETTRNQVSQGAITANDMLTNLKPMGNA